MLPKRIEYLNLHFHIGKNITKKITEKHRSRFFQHVSIFRELERFRPVKIVNIEEDETVIIEGKNWLLDMHADGEFFVNATNFPLKDVALLDEKLKVLAGLQRTYLTKNIVFNVRGRSEFKKSSKPLRAVISKLDRSVTRKFKRFSAKSFLLKFDKTVRLASYKERTDFLVKKRVSLRDIEKGFMAKWFDQMIDIWARYLEG